MNDEIPLFTTYPTQAGVQYRYHPLARTTDPATSHAGAASVRFRSSSQKGRLLAAFATGPAIAEEAAQRARLQHVGYWKRVSELLADGLIEETGDTARSRAGEACRIYRITAAGTAALR